MVCVTDTWMVYEQVNWVTVPQSVLNNVAANPLTARLNFDYESLVEGMTMVATKVNKGVVRVLVAEAHVAASARRSRAGHAVVVQMAAFSTWMRPLCCG